MRADKSFDFWTGIEEKMIDTLTRNINAANLDLNAKGSGVEEWALKWHGQVVACVLLVTWTQQTEYAFEEMDAEDPDIYAMEGHLAETQRQLSTFVGLI